MARDRGSMGCTTQLLLLVAVAFGALYVMGKIGAPAGGAQPQQRQIGPAVVRQALPLNRLETTTMVIDQLIEGKTDGNALQDFLYRDRLLLQARGEVIAGVDMSKLKESDIVVNGKTVTINLPPTEIFSSRIDNQSSFVYSRDTGLLTNGDPNLETQAIQQAADGLVPAACQRQILQEAALQAQKNVTALLTMLEFEQVIVNVPPGECKY